MTSFWSISTRQAALYLTHTRMNDRTVLRMSIGQARTELRHLEVAWEQI